MKNKQTGSAAGGVDADPAVTAEHVVTSPRQFYAFHFEDRLRAVHDSAILAMPSGWPS